MSNKKPNPTQKVLQDIVEERERQDEKWGEQNHPDRPHVAMTTSRLLHLLEIPSADRARHLYERAANTDAMAWPLILLEEFCEAMEVCAHMEEGWTEKDREEALKEELRQVAAVVIAWVECIDRRQLGRQIHVGGGWPIHKLWAKRRDKEDGKLDEVDPQDLAKEGD